MLIKISKLIKQLIQRGRQDQYCGFKVNLSSKKNTSQSKKIGKSSKKTDLHLDKL